MDSVVIVKIIVVKMTPIAPRREIPLILILFSKLLLTFKII